MLNQDEEKIMSTIKIRLELGQEKYGRFKREADYRDFKQEIFEEVIDAMIYAAMGILRDGKKSTQ